MDYYKYEFGAYNLHFIKTKKFNTINVSVNFKNYVKKEDITKRNLLKMLLIDSNSTYKTEREMSIKLEELYDLKLSSMVQRVGKLSILSLNMTVLNDDWTEKGNFISSLDFLLDIIFNPNIKDNAFDTLMFQKNVSKLKNDIISSKDNKTKYALLKLLELKSNEIISYNPYGYIEDLDNITPSSIYEYYNDVIKNDIIDIFILGDIDIDLIKSYLKDNLKFNIYKKDISNYMLEEVTPPKRLTKKVIKDDVNQTKLSILFRLNNLTEKERKYVLFVYNEILGGRSGNSMLFDTVREKNSLAYYINSIFQNYDNIFLIYSGIEKEKIDLAIKLIKKCMKEISKGNFSDEALNNCKKTIISNIDSNNDSPSAIIRNYYYISILNVDNIEVRKKNFESVTREEIINISKKVSIDSLLCLESGENVEEN